MLHVGIDLHLRRSTICVLDENGKKLWTHTVRGAWDKVCKVLEKVKPPYQVCFEATAGYGKMVEMLSPRASRVVVAHPGHLRLIFRSKKKNDRVDAEKLAKLLFLDEVPQVWVPPARIRAWRAAVEHRQQVLAERTRAKNELRALLRTHAITAPKGLWSLKGLEWLRGVALPNELEAVHKEFLLERLAQAGAMLKRTERALDKEARAHPPVALLQTIPGVGPRTSEAYAAYVGDPKRFGPRNGAGSYFGLVPCQDSSGDKERLGRITRNGPATARNLLVEAAWQAVRRSPTVRARFEGFQKGDPELKKKAVVATAHYLSRVMLAMMRTGEEWRESAE